jgi:Do/DeqQ family serine protease
MNNKLTIFGLGLLGGMLPLAAFVIMNGNDGASPQSDTILDSQSNNLVQRTGFNWSNAIPSEDFVMASESSLNSVVHVTTKVEKTHFQRDVFSEFFYGPGSGGRELKQYAEGSGSGVIIANDGYIVTNNHVIADAKEIEVTLNDNRKYKATVVGTDPSTDIAVLKIVAKNLKSLPLGNSDNLDIGEWVLAVGNPFNLTSTVTAGIVSAKARNLNMIGSGESNGGMVPIESFIQTDAAVNPGNSGGALVNTNGELIGINTAIASQTGSYSGYSFAIPVNLVKKVMKDLISYGVVQRGYLGIQMNNITQELKEAKNLKNLEGVYVANVMMNSGAKKAGIVSGDVILKVGNESVTSASSLQEKIGSRQPGDKVAITVRHVNGSVETKEIILRNKNGETSLITKKEIQKNSALGATFKTLSSKEKQELNITSGVKIESMGAGKLKSAGLLSGMIITKINNQSVKNAEELTNKLRESNGGVLLEVMTRSGMKDYVALGL